MKKLIIALLILIPAVIYASPATYYTYAYNSKFEIIRTQDAYLPSRTISEFDLLNPSDIYIDQNDLVYIADTGNKRVLVYDYHNDVIVNEIKNDLFSSVNGVYATEDGMIYVADSGAESVFILNPDGSLYKQIGRPDEQAFGDTDFRPSKVTVDRAKNIFVVGEGVYNGIIQLSETGEFLGYFASNDVKLSFVENLERMFYTDEQKALLASNNPITFTNIVIAENGSLYSTSMYPDDRSSYEDGTYKIGVQRHNTAGNNVLSINLSLPDYSDIYVTEDGLMFALSTNGFISVYSNTGSFIFLFGGSSLDSDISGLFNEGAGIAVGSDKTIWAIDNEKSTLQSFRPTDFALKTFEALDLFNDGKYSEAIEVWKEVLMQNQISVLAHSEIARNYLYQENYDLAMIHSKLSGRRGYYSDAFWEVRNVWLQDNLGLIFGLIILWVVFKSLAKRLSKLQELNEKYQIQKEKFLSKKRVKDFTAPFRALKHPIDTFDDVRRGYYGTVTSASIYYAIALFTYLAFISGKGFIYQFVAIEDIDFNSIVLGFIVLSFLFVVCNWLVTSINDGNGTLSQIFKVFSFSMLPIMLAWVITIALSYILTFNEIFFIETVLTIGLIWSFIQLFLGLSETHEYTIRENIKSLLLTVLFMLIAIVIILVIIIMMEQLYLFLISIIKEVIRNVS